MSIVYRLVDGEYGPHFLVSSDEGSTKEFSLPFLTNDGQTVKEFVRGLRTSATRIEEWLDEKDDHAN